MTRVSKVATVLFVLNDAFGISPASAQHPKHEHKEVHAAHKTPKPEHPHHPGHVEHTKKQEHQAVKHAAKKEDHRKGADKKHEHKKQEKKKEEHGKKVAEKNHQHTVKEKRIVETLHDVIKHMWRADHDYDNRGHEAHEHLRSALHELHAQAPQPSGKFGGLTQAESNVIYREALGQLQSVRSELSAKGAPAHHRAALRQIDEAMAKIHEALRIR